MSDFSSLVSTDWLAAHLDAPDVRIVDASMHLPDAGRDPRAEYDDAHIPGAVYLDMASLTAGAQDPGDKLPPFEKFASHMRKLGIGDGNRIVMYDNSAIASAFRGWWLLRYFGHSDVAVLDGGLVKWQAEERPVDFLPPPERLRHFTPRINSFALRSRDQMLSNIESKAEQVVDARSAERFSGATPEPRPNMRAGHIPGAMNVPYSALFKPDNTFKDDTDIAAAFESAGIDLTKPIVTTCGSGVTASVLAFALEKIGAREVALYDGSWADWGGRSDTPIETRA
ncbi:MAG: 3-mercaptopyruvate sulfurtransferase [Pseudomonadota bacterium]